MYKQVQVIGGKGEGVSLRYRPRAAIAETQMP